MGRRSTWKNRAVPRWMPVGVQDPAEWTEFSQEVDRPASARKPGNHDKSREIREALEAEYEPKRIRGAQLAVEVLDDIDDIESREFVEGDGPFGWADGR